MLEADKVFSGSIPENYDRHMVPLNFAPYLNQARFWKPPQARESSPARWPQNCPQGQAVLHLRDIRGCLPMRSCPWY